MAEHVRDRSPLQQKKSRVFWGTLEEKLMKLRKSLLEAADAITEIADELFSYDMKRNEEDDGKEKWAVSIAQQKPLTWHHPINIKMIMKSLTDLLDKVKKFPIEGMEEPLSRRLKKPLGIAIGNCEKILDEVEQFGQEGNKKYLDMLSSKINSIRKGIDKEFNTFIMEVELALIEKTLRERLDEIVKRALKEMAPLKKTIKKTLAEKGQKRRRMK
uniref:Uncharacterized protein n=1 Tax=Globodera rostochiensis TaxID=31243 RepID=A0A914HLI8_GLORO